MADLTGPRWGPKSGGPARQLIVLCHGVGADGHDLIDLAPSYAHAAPDAMFFAPDAPEPYDMAPQGRQWFSLADRTPAALEAGAARAAPVLNATVDAQLDLLGLTHTECALVGFSQGAMMVLYAGLRRTPTPRAVVAFSGGLIGAPGPGRPPVLLVHGEVDNVVPIARSRAAEQELTAAGVSVQTLWCPGLGHGIDPAGLSAGALFVQRAFAA